MTQPPRAMPLADWPDQDRRAWEAAFAEGDVFDGRGPGYHLSEGSRSSLRMAYRAWLGHLRDVDPAVLQEPPAKRVTLERIRQYIACLQARGLAASTIWNAIKQLYDAMRVIAPEAGWQWLKAIKARLEAQVTPRRKAHRLVDAGALLDLGLNMMDEADQAGDEGPADDRDIQSAVRFRTGLIIALLATRPLRRRTLAVLRIGTHLVRQGNDWLLILQARDLKSGGFEEWLIPDLLVPYLERYLFEVRPKFRHAEKHDGLWASDKGGSLSSQWIYETVCKATRNAFGEAINLHLFRDISATTVARAAPEMIGIAQHMLGHRQPTTTESYYNQAQSLEACRRNQANLDHLRQELRATYRRDRRRYQ